MNNCPMKHSVFVKIFCFFACLELDTPSSPWNPTSSGPKVRWWKLSGPRDPSKNVDVGSIFNQGGRCRWFIAWVAHVVKNCWWQQKAVHYPHGFRNESHTAKRHEKKGVAQLRHYQKSVVWLWFLFWLVRERMFQKNTIHFQKKGENYFWDSF